MTEFWATEYTKLADFFSQRRRMMESTLRRSNQPVPSADTLRRMLGSNVWSTKRTKYAPQDVMFRGEATPGVGATAAAGARRPEWEGVKHWSTDPAIATIYSGADQRLLAAKAPNARIYGDFMARPNAQDTKRYGDPVPRYHADAARAEAGEYNGDPSEVASALRASVNGAPMMDYPKFDTIARKNVGRELPRTSLPHEAVLPSDHPSEVLQHRQIEDGRSTWSDSTGRPVVTQGLRLSDMFKPLKGTPNV